jgi:2TM domain
MTATQTYLQNQLCSNYNYRLKVKRVSIFLLHIFCFFTTITILFLIDYLDDLSLQWSHWLTLIWLIILTCHFYITFLSLNFEKYLYERIKD